MSRLIPCSSCHSHVRIDDSECPHCGATLRTTSSMRVPAVLMGLALAGCPNDPGEPEYGVADTGPSTTGVTTTDTDGSDSGTDTGSGSGSATGMTDDGTSSGTSAEGSSSVGEPEYGVPETSSTSAGEPDYGVPETTSG